MKKLLILSLLITMVLTAMQCCKKDPKPVDPIDLLPPATQTGENTLGCLVNGEAFVVTNSSKMSAIYQGGFYQMSAMTSNSNESIAISIYQTIEEGKDYLIDGQKARAGYSIEYPDQSFCLYEKGNSFSGHIAINFFDSSSFIISGTFEFATVIDGCDTVRITNGRFDMQYIP